MIVTDDADTFEDAYAFWKYFGSKCDYSNMRFRCDMAFKDG